MDDGVEVAAVAIRGLVAAPVDVTVDFVAMHLQIPVSIELMKNTRMYAAPNSIDRSPVAVEWFKSNSPLSAEVDRFTVAVYANSKERNGNIEARMLQNLDA